MNAIHRKLLRELWHLRGQVLAIAVVIAGGVATLVMSLTSLDSLVITRDAYYADYRFAHVFATLKRAPESLRETIEAIPGVQRVETRVVAGANLDIPDFDDPASAVLVSLPDGRNAELNRLFLREGRLPEAGRDREVVMHESLANAHGLRPGDSISAIINGRRQTLDIVGIALSPEYIYQLKPGDLFPDFKRHGVLWMNREALAAAWDMSGAFNDVVLTLTRDARTRDVLDRLDHLLAPYGGMQAVDREDQLSHRYLALELEQLGMMATVFPTIFLGVAAFLLNVVLTRLIGSQRDQIAILKAFGYGNFTVGLHYAQMVLAIIALGLAIGIVVGLWFGQGMAEMYRMFFRFPYLEFHITPRVVVIGALVTVAAGLVGTLAALRRAMRLPPAEAMRPEPPPAFRATLIERFGLQRLFNQPTRMILRNIERRPAKALLTVVGIGMACGILTVGRFQEGALDYLIKVQFGLAQRDDLTVTFVEPTSRRVLHELSAIDGVVYAEPFRSSAVILHHGHRSYRTALQGLQRNGSLRRLLDDELNLFDLPPEGVVVNDFLAAELHLKPGDSVQVEMLEGRRETRELPVIGIIREFTGISAYMDIEALNRLLREGPAVSGAALALAPQARDAVVQHLKDMPRVAGVTDRQTAIRNFYESMADIVLTFAFFSTLLAGSIAFGVVYNSARIALTERSRELASLRVLGFTRGEIGYILIGELALLTLAAIPAGFVIGYALITYIAHSVESDLYRIPVVAEPSVFAFAATIVFISAAASSLIVARRLYHLDLVA
ncbi:MAG: FtsX-like permease family protein, partial [Chromatiales bacterium]|nr:FtsX-like permease family protein [Chromatiales bacterium]